MDIKQQDVDNLLKDIHRLAMSDDHMLVPYNSNDKLEMAHRVIRQMQQKLLLIADIAQTALGD